MHLSQSLFVNIMFLKNKLNTLPYPYELTILLFLLSSPKWFSNKAAKLKKVGSALTAAEALGGKQQQPKTNKEIKQKEDNSIDGGRYMPLYASINRNCIVCRINSEPNKLTQILRNSYLQIADILCSHLLSEIKIWFQACHFLQKLGLWLADPAGWPIRGLGFGRKSGVNIFH